MIDVFTLRGVGEVWNGYTNMTRNVTNQLDPNRFRTNDIRYPATAGTRGNGSMLQSRKLGKIELARQIHETPNIAGIVAYSLGAYTASDFLEDLAAGAAYTRGCKILFAAFISNPRRARSTGLPGYGIAGEHGQWPRLRTFEVANPADGITCCPDGSPLRTLPDTLDAFTFAVGGGWSADLADRIRRNRWQPTNVDWLRRPFGTWQSYDLAARLMRGYLYDGQHTVAYWRDGYTQDLADTINREVR